LIEFKIENIKNVVSEFAYV